MTRQPIKKQIGVCDTCNGSRLPVFKSWIGTRFWIWECERCLEEKEDDEGFVIQIR